MTTPIRRFIKSTFPWTIPIWEAGAAIRAGLSRHVVYETIHGFKLVGPECHLTWQQGTDLFEPAEIAWFKEKLKSTDQVIDVGANLGLYTFLALQHKVYSIAVEPQRRNVKAIREGLRLNGWSCPVIDYALTDQIGTAMLYGATSSGSSLEKFMIREPLFIRRKIPTCTLDHLLRWADPRSRILIKIDVEGHEYSVLLGAEKTLCRSPRPTWLLEIWEDERLGMRHPYRENIINLFAWHGYRGVQIAPESWVFEER